MTVLSEFLEWMQRSTVRHRLMIAGVHTTMFIVSGLLAFGLRFDFNVPQTYLLHLQLAVPVWVAAKLTVFRLMRLDQGWWQFVSTHDVSRIAVGTMAGSLISCLLLLVLAPAGFPRSIYILDFVLSLLTITGVRIIFRIVLDSIKSSPSSGKRIVIYGAGASGTMLAREIRSNAQSQFSVFGFVDDNPGKRGLRIQGLEVLDTGNKLPDIARKHAIEEVLIAVPSANGAAMQAILRRCRDAGIPCRTIPPFSEIIRGKGLASQIRDVALEDLLNRDPVTLLDAEISARISGRTVLVTGAGGSIGSELCRQIARFKPARLVGFDSAETALFHIESEMNKRHPGLFHPEVGSIQNQQRVNEVMGSHRPDFLFHAAAYKHVPMMEAHPFEAVENNVFGTCTLADAAIRHGAREFVLISTDKAVRPTSVMGVTKRLAELVVMSHQNASTRFQAVRFGNVLGSNGSVVPTFKRQIAAGGPVTVTHPDMKRYFMTIPEACQLVLQASCLDEQGAIFVLDMGEQVRIQDLAHNLILLSGLQPDKDINVVYTGIRPGEKLYEELHRNSENMIRTCHEKIMVFDTSVRPAVDLDAVLRDLRSACASRDIVLLKKVFREAVPDYRDSPEGV